MAPSGAETVPTQLMCALALHSLRSHQFDQGTSFSGHANQSGTSREEPELGFLIDFAEIKRVCIAFAVSIEERRNDRERLFLGREGADPIAGVDVLDIDVTCHG